MTPALLNITPELAASTAAKADAARALLADIAGAWSPAAFANSLGAEDMVLTDLIVKAKLPIEVFSLDTGRLPAETYDLMAAVDRHYGLKLKLYFPQAEEVESYVRQHGINAFYDSVTLRKACCYARKVEPLRRALAGKRAWITGMRAEQAATRGQLATQEYDEGNGLEKFNPLAAWSENEVWTYIKQNAVPYNALHDKFYPSIGCAPCTRAVSLGEDIRAGRWWWEAPESKECGLHVKA
ncbi:phosphoadenylyl-sulfate reductase [uncultured Azonexus sp.]|uniref:phosphoadenylyl-sulfate reductase n=1 Tax=uncultured Azonexus sp. TaxID=520307 RepID=UPI00260DE77E|nr:phosphoadenylyl-sulfate reductase [uncultured Azonexus sp.]